MTVDTQFSHVLRKYIELSPLSYAELARRAGLPNKTTISNWLNGVVKRPRHWQDIVQLAQALNLDSMETDEVLRAASLPSLLEISKAADSEEDVALLTPLIEDLNRSLQNALFRVTVPEPQLIIGREQAIETITRTLKQTNGTCILHGMGGVGKSHLAAHIAYTLRPFFPEGVLWINLGGSNPIADAYQFIASTYKISPTSWHSEQDLKAQIWQMLEEKRALLIFDGLQREQHFEELFPSKSKCSALVTTQINYFAQSHGIKVTLSPFTENDCIQMFTRVLGEIETQENVQSIRTIAKLVGRLPLAIHIVASYLLKNRFITIKEYAQELEDEQNRLKILSEDSGKIDYEIEACFEISFNQLTKPAKDLFPKLAVFAGYTFSQEAIQVIGPKRGLARALGELVNYSLLEESHRYPLKETAAVKAFEQKRFHLNPMLRLFAQQKLQPEQANQPPRSQLKKDLAENFNEAELVSLCFDLNIDYENLAGNIKDLKIIELLKRAERNEQIHALQERVLKLRPFLDRPALEDASIQTLQHDTCQYFIQLVTENKVGNFSLLDSDQDNILYALQWAANNQEWDLFLQGLQAVTFVNLGLLGYLDAAGLWRHALKHLEQAINHTVNNEPSFTQAVLLFKAGAFQAKLAEFQSAQENLEKALRVVQSLSESHKRKVLLTAYIYDTLAQCEMHNNHTLAMTYSVNAQKSLNNESLPKNDPERGYFWIRHGSVLGISGKLSEAEAAVTQGLPLLPSHTLSLAHILGQMTQGGIFFSTDRPAAAIAAWEKGFEIADKLGDVRRKAMISQNIAVQSSKSGEFNKAETFFRQAQDIYIRVGDTVGVIDIWLNYGHDCMVRGQDLQAYKLLQKGLKLAMEKGRNRLAVVALLNLSRLLLLQEKADEASKLLNQAAQLIKMQGLAFFNAELLRLQAHHAIVRQEFAAGDSLLDQALAEVEDEEEAGIIWQLKGVVQFRQGNWEAAKAAYIISVEKAASSSKFEWATSLCLLGKAYLAEGKEIETGKEYLSQARESFSEMKIKQKADEIRIQLAALD